MNTKEMLMRGINLSRRNVLLFVPTIVAAVIAGLISMLGGLAAGAQTVELGPGTGIMSILASGMVGRSIVVAMIFGALSSIVTLLGHGMTIAVAHQVTEGRDANLRNAFDVVRARIVPLVIASVIAGLLVGIGAALLVLPGVIVAFLLMFTFVAVIAGDYDALGALKKSFDMVKENFSESLILFLILLAVGVLFAIVSAIFAIIPWVGAIIGLLITGVFVGFTSVLLLLGYSQFEALPAPAEAKPIESKPENEPND